MQQASGATPFKTCTLCGHQWRSRDHMLSDPAVELVGYQAFSEQPAQGMLLFNHNVCGTTVALPVHSLEELESSRSTGGESLYRSETCPGHCVFEGNLESCSNTTCTGAWVRELIQRVRRWPKQS